MLALIITCLSQLCRKPIPTLTATVAVTLIPFLVKNVLPELKYADMTLLFTGYGAISLGSSGCLCLTAGFAVLTVILSVTAYKNYVV